MSELYNSDLIVESWERRKPGYEKPNRPSKEIYLFENGSGSKGRTSILKAIALILPIHLSWFRFSESVFRRIIVFVGMIFSSLNTLTASHLANRIPIINYYTDLIQIIYAFSLDSCSTSRTVEHHPSSHPDTC